VGLRLFRRGAYHAPDTLHGEKPASRRPCLNCHFLLPPPLQGGEPGPQEPLRLLLGAEGMSVLLIKFQVKGDHVLHCGLRRGECAPLIAPAAVIPVGASVGVAPHVLGGIPQHWQKIRSSISGSSFCSGGVLPSSVPSGYAWIPDTECPVSYRAAIFFPVRPRTSRQEAGASTSTWSPKERRKPSSHLS